MVMKGGKPAIAQDFGVKTSPSAQHRRRILAVDPGDVHVGVAEFEEFPQGWICTWAHEYTPEEFKTWLVEGLRKSRWVRLVVESWKLFPQAAALYVGSDMPTSRLIGAIDALVQFVPEDGGWFDQEVKITLQDPTIKVPTRGYLKRRKLRSVAKILGIPLDHAPDAELHGYKFLIDRGQPLANVVAFDKWWAGTRDLSGRHSIW